MVISSRMKGFFLDGAHHMCNYLITNTVSNIGLF